MGDSGGNKATENRHKGESHFMEPYFVELLQCMLNFDAVPGPLDR